MSDAARKTEDDAKGFKQWMFFRARRNHRVAIAITSIAMPAKSRRRAEFVNAAMMTAEQASRLKQLACDAFEPEAFRANLTQTEAQRRIATLAAKLVLLDEPPHTL